MSVLNLGKSFLMLGNGLDQLIGLNNRLRLVRLLLLLLVHFARLQLVLRLLLHVEGLPRRGAPATIAQEEVEGVLPSCIVCVGSACVSLLADFDKTSSTSNIRKG